MRALVITSAVIGTLVGAFHSFPLSWIAGDAVRMADPDAAAHGTIWQGHLSHIDGLPPISTVLQGRTVRVAANGPGLQLDGVAGLKSVSDISLALPIRSLSRFDPRMAGLSGTFNISVDSLSWTDAGCTEATGTARTDVLASNSALWNWSGPRLQGPVSCRDGNVVVAMTGSDEGGVVDAEVSISPAGPYRTTISIDTRQPEAGIVLPLFGFEPSGSQWRLSEAGSWQ